MNCELKWAADREATVLHACDLLRRGVDLTEPRLAEALSEPAQRLAHQLDLAGLTGEQIRQHLIPLGVQTDSHRQLAETLMRKTIGGLDRWEAYVAPTAGLVTEACQAAKPLLGPLNARLAESLTPLHEQCTIHLNALLSGIANQTDQGLIPSQAEVIALPSLSTNQAGPIGGGTAYILYNMASLEAVPDSESDATAEESSPAKSSPPLPEAVRLAWLVAQLNIDLPMYSENLPRDAGPLIGALAMLPPALVAGEELELCRFDRETLAAALVRWQIVGPEAPDLTAAVLDWWDTYKASSPPIPIALGALLRMIEQA